MEREMRDYLYENGHMALRMPASGAAPDYDLPDLLASINGVQYAIELKATSKDAVRFSIGDPDADDEEDDINQLIRFAEDWHAVPVLAARFPYDKHSYYIQDPFDWLDHPYGSFQLKKADRDEFRVIDAVFRVDEDQILGKEDLVLNRIVGL